MWSTGAHLALTGSLFVCLCLSLVHGQGEELNGLFPVVFNLATRARISVNATCGEREPEVFCKLVEHVRIFPAENRHCDICDARSNNPAQRHPITNAIDGSQKWWQSPTLTNGGGFNHVTITLDLGQIYQIAYIIIKAANAPRPGNWILERSLDGVTYRPWQYFAMTDRECEVFYRVRATPGVPDTLRDDEVICTSRYSHLNPLEGGEIFVSLVNGRPGVFQPSKVLLDFTSARYVQLRFQKIRTLHADLMTFSNIDASEVDSTVTRRYFYSIKDISIGGQCICYGHASYCRRHDTMEDRLQCQCLHNTAGDNCEQCLPMFNQKPWQVGGIQNIGCEQCNCHGKADECVYNATVDALGQSLNMEGEYDGGGVCLNCREFTTGINCERCIDGYYRPLRMTPNDQYPCRRCSCTETLTSTDRCVLDDSRVDEGLYPGDCLCKEGFAGRSCDQCAEGYFGFPNCRKCRCNAAGTRDPDACEGACVCKANVEGSRCDQCKRGYFNLDPNNPDGCTRCFCFGVSSTCDSVGWGLERVQEMDGWMLSTLQPGGLTLLPRPFNEWLEAKTYLLNLDDIDPRSYSQDDIHYWVAPMTYLGNRLSSYGGYLEFTIKYSLDGQLANRYHLSEPNLVLEGSNLSITTDKEYLREDIENKVRIRLHEDSWYHLGERRPVTREEMMTVLYSLNRLLIRATYHTAQETVYLRDVVLEMASPMVMDGSSLPSVEQCRCPQGYAGLSCESCSPGWRRVGSQLNGGQCQQCACYNHATECDPVDGRCLGCRHSTTGDHCERCLPGFYGDPRHGTPNDCKPCACPLISGNNFFAERCVARPTLEDRDAYECVNCREGFTGSRCEMCAPGYYGNPTTPGGTCRRCNCGGNIDINRPGSCNNVTGACNICANNTEGEYCERCRSGFYGSAVNGDCRPCDCYERGSNSPQCNPQNGQCSCRSRYTGRRCDRCQRGYGNIERGCDRCQCNREGSESTECDPVTGQCRCRPGVGGLACDQCVRGYFDFSRTGCKRCNCYGAGTNNTGDCDPNTGRCICRPGVTGTSCDTCQPNHFGVESGQGCTPCDCSRTGSTRLECDGRTGQCDCRPGVGGRRCDRCQPGYYGLSLRGCERCEPCDKPGHICDQNTGECVCPPNTEGPNCEICVTNGWGYDKDGGCKENVEGRQCDKCRPGTFSLDKDNPKGCTECYCFLRAQSCDQAPYVWTQIEMSVQSATLERPGGQGKPLLRKFGHLVINDTYTTVPDDLSDRPLYWQLPDYLPKDMVLSYSGKLSFVHYFEGPPPTSGMAVSAPLVIMVGNGIEIHTGISSLEAMNPLQYEIPLHEDTWSLPGRSDAISRRMMMVVLQNVEAILVRAVQDGRSSYAELGPITIQRAAPRSSNVTSTNLALGVELCDCPDRYSGTSCQNPGEGYYRVKPPPDSPNLADPEAAIGYVKPCQCYGHSSVCDPETGKCFACQDNTAGDLCEKCADGYYGVATRGTPNACQPCACPLPDPSNNFSPKCMGGRQGMMCTECAPGHTGMRCERCLPGYYGNPTQLGDRCKPCNCNPEGSRDTSCDPVTGQCPCLSGIEGRTCEACTDPTYGVEDGECVSCYTGCTGILLADLANMSVPLVNINISGAVYPWERLYTMEREANELRDKLAGVEAAGIQGFQDMKNEADRYSTMADNLVNRSQFACDAKLSTTGAEACRVKSMAEEILKNATDLEQVVKDTFDDIKKMVEGLDELVERLLYNQGGVNMTGALEEAKRILDEILARDFGPADRAAKRENTLAEELSERIRDLGLANFNGTDVKIKLDDVRRRLEDLVNQTNTAGKTAQEALDKIRLLKDLLTKLTDIKNEIKKLHEDAMDIIKDAEDLLTTAETNLITSTGQNELMEVALDSLRTKVNDLRLSLPKLEVLSVQAIEHALDLKRQAEEIDMLFQRTRDLAEDAVRAAKAYKDIVDAINDAKKAANDALKAAKESADIAKVDDLLDEVNKLIDESRRQLNEANDLVDLAQDLADTLSQVEADLDEAVTRQKSNREDLDEIKRKLDLLPSDFRDRLAEIEEKNRKSGETVEDALELIRKLNNTLGPKMNELRNFDANAFNFEIGSEIARAKDASKDVVKMLELERKIDERRAAIMRKMSGISANLTDLKAKIRDARSNVNNMKMSLQADGQCYRSYRSPLQPSSTNEIRFAFKLNGTVSDMLIILLQQSPQEIGEEFLAAEVRDQKVRLSWNSGKGQGSVSHGQQVEADKWYQVIAKRVGSVGQLKVWSLEESTEQATKQEVASMGAGCSLMNLNENSTIFLAGSSDLYQIPSGITRKNFVGCVGDVSIDSKSFGVYNFKTNVEGHCDACDEVPEVTLESSKVYVFNGRGFALFEVREYSSRRTKVELEFKTFWENSNIFFVGNTTLGDFLSIELREGKVYVNFNMGGGSSASGQTNNTYNNNKWTKITFERYRLDAVMNVGSEKVTMKSPGPSTGLDLSGAPMYFGGLPTNLNTGKFKDMERNDFFYGCMRDLSFGTLSPDDDTSILVNVVASASCRENGIHNVDFRGDGYLNIQTEHLDFDDQTNDISLTFVTEKEDGVLLIARDIPGENYYSISLVDGRLDARIRADGAEPVIITSSERFNDGKRHCVSLLKNGRTIELVADDKVLGSGVAQDVSFNNNGDLYLGGSPIDVDDMAATNEKLDGCISDVIANGELLSMSDAKQYRRADVGRCRFTTDLNAPVVVPKATEEVALPVVDQPAADDPKSCAIEPLLEKEDDAKSVANSATFFADITKIRKRDLARNFNFSFDFRTYYPDGLFGYLMNRDGTFYFGIQLNKGVLEVVYILGGSRVRVGFNEALNDGQWHSVFVSKTAEVLLLSYDAVGAKSDVIDKVLDIKLPLHLGGPEKPDNFKDYGIDLVPFSIRGCIRTLKVNGHNVNITDTQVIQDVGGCYKNVEAGAYFGGDAWAVYTPNFVLKPRYTISMDFRTTSPSGVLVSVSSSRQGYGLTLELHEGKVKLAVITYDGEFRAETSNDNRYLFCDSKWHSVRAAYIDGKLSVSVDGLSTGMADVTGPLTEIQTSSPLFIGGFSERFQQAASLSEDMFSGCIRNLAMDGKAVDWYELPTVQNVRKTACPTS